LKKTSSVYGRHAIFDRQPVKYPIGYMTGQILSPVKRARS